jgi:DNA modification methylase
VSLPKPYYTDDAVAIYHADCREILPLLESNSVDLVLTDPPYGVGFDYGTSYKDSEDGYIEWLWPALEMSEIAVRDGGRVAIWQASKWAKNWGVWFPRDWRLIALPLLFGQILPLEVQRRTDYVLWWRKGNLTNYPKDWRPEDVPFRDFYVSSVVLKGRDPLLSGHPCPRPIDSTRFLSQMLCPPEGIILDPFMGSGTTLRAAKDLGRKAIGIEIEERYAEIAAKRMSQMVLPL